ncbi:hypothetical protein ABZ078_26715 [Streptomyces sp. NPDC006385]|uniref:hypothetical protein n=1 Tax=Streptomyces sp. NPDC006385 TaxID=3156761 RepID=UPI0033B3D41B
MLCGQARDGEFLERGELGNGLVPLSQAFLELGDLGLEPFDLRDPRVDDLSGLLQSTKAPLEPFDSVSASRAAFQQSVLICTSLEWVGRAMRRRRMFLS